MEKQARNRYLLASALHIIQKQLREDKGVDIDITLYGSIDTKCNPRKIERFYEYRIFTGDKICTSFQRYASYETALVAGLRDALKSLKEKEGSAIFDTDGLSLILDALELLEGTI